MSESKAAERDYGALISEYLRSGGSLKSFAASKNVPYTTLAYWKNKLCGDGPKPRRRPAPPVPMPVEVVAIPEPPRLVVLELRSGHTLRIPVPFDGEQLRTLVRILESC
jgi:hypothetical protein